MSIIDTINNAHNVTNLPSNAVGNTNAKAIMMSSPHTSQKSIMIATSPPRDGVHQQSAAAR